MTVMGWDGSVLRSMWRRQVPHGFPESNHIVMMHAWNGCENETGLREHSKDLSLFIATRNRTFQGVSVDFNNGPVHKNKLLRWNCFENKNLFKKWSNYWKIVPNGTSWKTKHFIEAVNFSKPLTSWVPLLLWDSAIITTAILLPNQIFHFQWLFEARTKRTSRLVFCAKVLCFYGIGMKYKLAFNQVWFRSNSFSSFRWEKEIFFKKENNPSAACLWCQSGRGFIATRVSKLNQNAPTSS